MATATERKNREFLDGGIEPTPDGHLGRKPGRRWWKWLLAGVVLLGLVVWLLPTIVGNTPLLGLVVNWAAADFEGTVTVDEASLGWFSKPTVVGIKARDAHDRPLVEIPSVSGSRTLLEILRDTSNLGSILIEKPKISVEIDEQGNTNIEKALAEYLTADGEPYGPIDLELKIIDGEVSIADAQSGQAWKIDKLQLDLKVPAATSEAISLKTSGEIIDADTSGRFSVAMKLSQATSGKSASVVAGPAGSDQLELKTQNMPLAILGPILGRFAPQTQLSGRLSSTVECRFDRNTFPELLVANIDVTARDFFLATPELQSDRVQLEQFRAAGQISLGEGQVHIDELVVESDVGELSLAGTFDLGGKPIGQSWAPLLYQDYECRAEVDLARLATMLPSTLRIRDKTRITSGQIKLSFSSRHGGADRTWTGQVEATRLEAVSNGRNLSWNQPVSIIVHAATGPSGPVIQSLRCKSDFLELAGAGTLDDFTATARFDLGQLTAQLNSLVELGPYRPAGKGEARFDWHRTRQQQFRAQGEIEIRDFRLAAASGQELTEESLVLAVSASGQTDFTSNSRVDQASLEIEADSDALAVRIVEPIADLRAGGTWPLAVEMEGDLARWQTRLAPWFSAKDWMLGGTCDLSTEVTVSADSISFAQLDVSVQRLRVAGPSINLYETSADLTVRDGRWENGARRLEIKSAQLAAASVAVEADNVVLDLGGEGSVELAGNVTYQGDADRIQQWLTVDASEPSAWTIYGRFSGQAEFGPIRGATNIDSVTAVKNLVATHRSGYRHREDEISLRIQGEYNPRTGTVDLGRVELNSSLIGGNVAGRMATVNGKQDLQLTGRIDYDLDGVTKLLPIYLGRGVYLGGRDTAEITYRGPLSLDAAQASTDFRWAWASLYGFQVGPGSLNVTLAGNSLRVKSSELEVSEGRVWLNAQLRQLQSDSQSAVEFYIPPGQVAQQIRINPQMCASALQYVAPVLAGVTSAEGRFSIELDGGRIPLGNPYEGDLAGRMTVDSIQVGPGPLVRELALVLGYESPAKIARDSVISFRMVDGRVYHRDLELVFPDLTIRTHGSVGIGPADRSLAIMAEMPIPPKLLGHHAALDTALRNQTIRLPIGGTLDNPRIDSREIDRLTRQFMESAAQNLIQDELTKGLQSLFGTQE
jgi:translocation and assembly module TamB